MLKRLLQVAVTSKSFCPRCSLSQLAESVQDSHENSIKITEGNSLIEADQSRVRKSLLEPLSEDISHIATYLKPTFNFAAYVNKSETLQEFVKLGVNLHFIEKKITEAVPFVLGLKFDDIKGHIIFLKELELENDDIANLLTKNPFIFKENLEDLEIRINYLKFKRFTDEMITRVVGKNPFWLSYSTQEIDEKLGFFQKNFKLTGSEIRQLSTKNPKLITENQNKIKVGIFVVKEEMGFNEEEIKEIILRKPKILLIEQNKLLKTFEYLHNVMKIPHDRIVQTPEILTCRAKRLKERHQFLVKLGRDQFDPREPNYIAPTTIIKDTDTYFSTEVAKSSIQAFNLFLKTL